MVLPGCCVVFFMFSSQLTNMTGLFVSADFCKAVDIIPTSYVWLQLRIELLILFFLMTSC